MTQAHGSATQALEEVCNTNTYISVIKPVIEGFYIFPVALAMMLIQWERCAGILLAPNS